MKKFKVVFKTQTNIGWDDLEVEADECCRPMPGEIIQFFEFTLKKEIICMVNINDVLYIIEENENT